MHFNHLEVDLLKISQEASKHKKEDSEVINATIGVFLNEHNSLYSFKTVDKAIDDIDRTLIRSYLSNNGGEKYLNNVVKYVFKHQLDTFKDYYINANWTSGGSGAIYMSFSHFQGHTVLLPNLRWPEYDTICLATNKKIVEYNFIKNNKFDLNSIKQILDNFEEKELMLVINDPAHNPSGYNMNKDEYKEFINLLNRYSNIKINVLFDLAYLDFSNNDFQSEILPLYNNFSTHVNLYLAFSGSKSFGVYGFRMGALIQLTRKKSQSKRFKEDIYLKTSAIFGAPNSMGIVLLNDIILKEDLKKEQFEAKVLLEKRSKLMLKELDENNISYFPYESGFFLTVKVQNPLEATKRLKKEKVYVVPTYNGLRIAISALKEEEITRLVKIIKKEIK